MIRLNRTYYLLLNFTSKIFQNLVFRAKFKQIKQNPLNSLIYSANCAKLTPIMNLFVLCFRHLPRQRTLRNSSELRKFRTIRPQSPRITRNSHILLTYSTLCFKHLHQQRTLRNSSELCKFHAIRPHSPGITRNSHHLLTLYTIFRCLTSGRELSKIPANQAKFAQFAHLSREFCAFHSKLIHI